MRIATRLFVVSFLSVGIGRSELAAQAAAATARAPDTTATPASVRWNRLVPRFVEEATARRRAARTAAAGDSAALRRINQQPAPIPFRLYTLLSVAQYGAASSARGERATSQDAAVAAASALVLAELFPDSAVRASINRELERDLARARSKTRGAARAVAGRRVGEDAARRVIAWAPPIDMTAGLSGTAPTGPGMWRSAPGVPMMGTFLVRSRTWLLDSASQYRPGPPPSHDSPTFLAALEEVRKVARERTPEQIRIAQRWNRADPWTVWNELASAALRRHRVPDPDAARVLAVLNAAAMDAAIACFDAKYHYWTFRPSHADTALTLADSVDLPNFPSYPSGHACSAGAFDAVLGHYLPQERAEFTRVAEEQAMSRLYGGIHYRFDNDVGLALGRAVGRHAVEREQRGGLNAWRTAKTKPKR